METYSKLENLESQYLQCIYHADSCWINNLKTRNKTNVESLIQTGVKHPGRGKHNHGPGVVDVAPVERLDVLKVEHVSIDKSLSNLLVGPRDEHLVKVCRLLREASTEVDGTLEVHPVPVSLEEDTELLGPAEGKHGDQHLAALVDGVVHLLEKVPLPAPLAVPHRGGVGGLGDEEVGPALVYPGGPEVAVRRHVVVPGVDDRLIANTHLACTHRVRLS